MTPRFEKAVDYVFEHEGKFNDVKNDKGGVTSWGISLRFLKTIGAQGDIDGDGDVDWLDIKKLDKEHAESIYYNNFWKPFYDVIQEKLGIKVFDTAVNAGHSRAHKLLQQSLNDLGSKLVVDGMIGRTTLSECVKYKELDVCKRYSANQKKFYDSLVVNDPTQVKFIKGWTKRAMWLPK